MSRKESQEAYSSRIPIFDGTNYAFWKVGMEAYLMSLEVYVWTLVLVDYNVLDIPPTNADGKKIYGNNAKAKNSIFFGLIQSKLVKVMHCKFAKDMWVNLNQSHEGDDKSSRQNFKLSE